jgi:hypothetical protein
MPVLVFMSLLLALLLFIVWESRQSAKPVSREQMSRGFVPRGLVKWVGLLGLAFVGFLLGISEFLNPSAPPFAGRGALMMAWAHEAMGVHGPALVWLGLGCVLLLAAWVSHRSAHSTAPR